MPRRDARHADQSSAGEMRGCPPAGGSEERDRAPRGAGSGLLQVGTTGSPRPGEPGDDRTRAGEPRDREQARPTQARSPARAPEPGGATPTRGLCDDTSVPQASNRCPAKGARRGDDHHLGAWPARLPASRCGAGRRGCAAGHFRGGRHYRAVTMWAEHTPGGRRCQQQPALPEQPDLLAAAYSSCSRKCAAPAAPTGAPPHQACPQFMATAPRPCQPFEADV